VNPVADAGPARFHIGFSTGTVVQAQRETLIPNIVSLAEASRKSVHEFIKTRV